MQKRYTGFTLIEMALVVATIGLLLGTLMYTLRANVDTARFTSTRIALEDAAEKIVFFAMMNRRLPCPASSTSSGLESFCTTVSGACTTTTTVQTHGRCSNHYDGFVPASSLGLRDTDADGYVLDAHGNRLRLAVTAGAGTCSAPVGTPVFTSASSWRTYGTSCTPNDLDICVTATGTNSTSCNTAKRAVDASTVAFIVLSIGPNGANTSDHGGDERENTDADPVFVWRTPTDSAASAGTYDDQLTFVPLMTVLGRLVASGMFP